MAEILEHIAFVERRVVGLLEAMLTQPPEPGWHATTAAAALAGTAVVEPSASLRFNS